MACIADKFLFHMVGILYEYAAGCADMKPYSIYSEEAQYSTGAYGGGRGNEAYSAEIAQQNLAG